MDRCLFPPYIPRKALDRKSFPVHDACTFVFVVDNDALITEDGLGGAGGGDGEASKLVRVTQELIENVRSAHLVDVVLSKPKSRRHKY